MHLITGATLSNEYKVCISPLQSYIQLKLLLAAFVAVPTSAARDPPLVSTIDWCVCAHLLCQVPILLLAIPLIEIYQHSGNKYETRLDPDEHEAEEPSRHPPGTFLQVRQPRRRRARGRGRRPRLLCRRRLHSPGCVCNAPRGRVASHTPTWGSLRPPLGSVGIHTIEFVLGGISNTAPSHPPDILTHDSYMKQRHEQRLTGSPGVLPPPVGPLARALAAGGALQGHDPRRSACPPAPLRKRRGASQRREFCEQAPG